MGITPELLGQSSKAEAEPGEELYMMVGDYIDDHENIVRAALGEEIGTTVGGNE